MLHHPTYDKLTRLKLFGMARAFAGQSALDLDHLGFDERLGLLVSVCTMFDVRRAVFEQNK